jgi:CheY-specific phosphatase CheX
MVVVLEEDVMSEILQQLVCQTVAEVYGTMFFTFLETAEEVGLAPDPLQAVFLEAVIAVNGKESKGEVHFYYPETLARHVASNFLGIDADQLDDRQMHDMLGEAANMTVGSLLGKLDTQNVCGTLGMPAVRQPSLRTIGDIMAQPDTIAFHSDFGWLLVGYGVVKRCCRDHGERP